MTVTFYVIVHLPQIPLPSQQLPTSTSNYPMTVTFYVIVHLPQIPPPPPNSYLHLLQITP
jgi:hypothetical protein